VEFYNQANEKDFIISFANVVEHTQKVAREICKQRPFTNRESFIAALNTSIDGLTDQEKIEVLENHPDLAGRLAEENLLTSESTREQKEAGLHLLTQDQRSRLKSHNKEYREKFGFTFIICARENKAAAILNGLDQRLSNTKEEEIQIGIGEVKKIARLRSLDILDKYTVQSKK